MVLVPRDVSRVTFGSGVGKVGDVGRAGALERLALIGGDRDRHVLQALRPAPGGDDDVGILARNGGGGVVERLVGGGGGGFLRGGASVCA